MHVQVHVHIYMGQYVCMQYIHMCIGWCVCKYIHISDSMRYMCISSNINMTQGIAEFQTCVAATGQKELGLSLALLESRR